MDISDIRARVARMGAMQGEVATLCGIDHTAFSHMLSGRRRPPKDFARRVQDALSAIEAARAAYRRELADRGYENAPLLAERALHRRPQRHERRKGTGESPARIRALAS